MMISGPDNLGGDPAQLSCHITRRLKRSCVFVRLLWFCLNAHVNAHADGHGSDHRYGCVRDHEGEYATGHGCDHARGYENACGDGQL